MGQDPQSTAKSTEELPTQLPTQPCPADKLQAKQHCPMQPCPICLFIQNGVSFKRPLCCSDQNNRDCILHATPRSSTASLSLVAPAKNLLSLHFTRSVVMYVLDSKLCIESGYFPLFQTQERTYINFRERAESESASCMGTRKFSD